MANDVAQPITISRANHLANLLHQDISRRGLQPGEPYLTDVEASQLLQVGRVTANRAMQVLARRGMLVRRKRAGTFIGPQIQPMCSSLLQCVHFILPPHRKYEPLSEKLIEGLHAELPGVQLQLNMVPSQQPAQFLRELTRSAVASGIMTGMVLLSTTRDIRQFFNKQGLPVVVSGHVEDDIDLPWVDRDQRQIGHLLAEFLTQQGHRRIAIVMRDNWAPGDNLLVDGITQQLNNVNVASTMCSAPREASLAIGVVRGLLERPQHPTAIICREEEHARYAMQAAEALGLSVPGDVQIAVATQDRKPGRSQCPFVTTSRDARTHGMLVGRMLAQLSQGQRPDPDHYEMAVQLELPVNDTIE